MPAPHIRPSFHNILPPHSFRSNHAIRANRYIIAYHRPCADLGVSSDRNCSAQIRSNCHMYIIFNHATMINRRTGIHNTVFAESGKRVHDRSVHNDCSGAAFCGFSHHCLRMNQCRNRKAMLFKASLYCFPDCTIFS